ncbi:MAG: helix-turn-helix domain-containing protein [Myxococcales bacterium]|nr:helix-turn-helix domain-containing protein [Myxococcales bacterium]
MPAPVAPTPAPVAPRPPPLPLGDQPMSPAVRKIRNRAEWEAHERQQILDALVRCGWNKTQAARELNVSRRNLYRKIERYGIEGHDAGSTG